MALQSNLAPASSGSLGCKRVLDPVAHELTEIRTHGRGGQGTVVASKVLVRVLDENGIWLQSFPTYGVEWRSAPAASDNGREAKSRVPVRAEITYLHHSTAIDTTPGCQMNRTEGTRPGDLTLINSTSDGRG